MKPTFLCGSDNRTYSSPCRLEYHNCIHHTSVRIACKGFCPCKGEDRAYLVAETFSKRWKSVSVGSSSREHRSCVSNCLWNKPCCKLKGKTGDTDRTDVAIWSMNLNGRKIWNNRILEKLEIEYCFV